MKDQQVLKDGHWRYYLDNQEVTENEYRERYPRPSLEGGFFGTEGTSTWPIVSGAFAVHPKQVEQARARAKRHGINVEYRPDGKAILPSRKERQKLGRLEQMHDNDGGYGDC